MRIGIDYTAAVRQQAGIGRYTRGLIRALAEVDPVNQYVLLSAGREACALPWPDNFTTRALPISDRHMAIFWQKLRVPLPVECVTGPLDLFHSPDFVLPPVRKARTALTVHDLSFMRLPECSSPPLLQYLTRAVPPSVNRADLVLADSESTRQDLIELLYVPPSRIRVIYPALDTAFWRRDDAEVQAVKRRYGLDGPYILSVGTLQPRKNYVRLIEAYAGLRESMALPHHLVIVGARGWLHEPIDTAIADLGLGTEVRLLGHVAEGDLPALYSGADVFAFPSLYEGFGFPVLEAMACGTPVVASDASSLPEVAGDAALLVAPTDTDAIGQALRAVLEDSTLRERLVQLGYARCHRFSWRDSAERLLDAYRTLIPDGGPHVRTG